MGEGFDEVEGGFVLAVDRVTAEAGVGRAALAKHFREKQGVTLNQYLLHKRIDRAKSLLITSSYSIKEVGVSVGIPDQHYFNKQFRKIAGESPSLYRENHQLYTAILSPDEATRDGEWE